MQRSLRCGHSSQLHTTLWARIDSTARRGEFLKTEKTAFCLGKKSEIIWNNVKRRKSEKNMDFIQSAFDAMKAPLVLCRAPGYPPLLKELLQAQPFSAAPAGDTRRLPVTTNFWHKSRTVWDAAPPWPQNQHKNKLHKSKPKNILKSSEQPTWFHVLDWFRHEILRVCKTINN